MNFNYEEFTRTAFKVILKSDKYNKLKYIRLKINNEMHDRHPHGVVYKCTITIFLDKILFDKAWHSIRWIKGYIVFVITHELSHLLQGIDGIKYIEDIKYRYFIEASADITAVEYIKEQYNIFKKSIGNFSLEPIETIELYAIEYLNKR
jgi:hypothetical protein